MEVNQEGKYDDDIGELHYAEIVKALLLKIPNSGDKRQKNRDIAAETMRIIKNGYRKHGIL